MASDDSIDPLDIFPSDKPQMPEDVHAEYHAAKQTCSIILMWQYKKVASEEDLQKLEQCQKIVDDILEKYAPPRYFMTYATLEKTNKPKMTKAKEEEYHEMDKRLMQISYWEEEGGITPEESKEREELRSKQEALLETYAEPFPVAFVAKPR